MKYTKREIISAYRILTKNIQQNDLGWRGKMILRDVLDDYFSHIEGEKVDVGVVITEYNGKQQNSIPYAGFHKTEDTEEEFE